MTAPNVCSTATRRPHVHPSPAPCRGRVCFEELTAEQGHEDHGQEKVDRREGDKRYDETRHRRDGVGWAHHALNDPRVAADPGADPPGPDRQEAERTGDAPTW